MTLSQKYLLAMLSFLAQIKMLDSYAPRTARPRLEPRRSRRQEARDAVLASQAMRSRTVLNNSVKHK